VKKFLAVAGVAAVLCSAGARSFAAGPIVGYVSDQECALKSAKASTAKAWIQPAVFESCVKDCIKKEGGDAVFVTEDNKILKFDAASKKKIEAFLGHKVSVTGKVEGGTIAIDTITGLKLQ
jgi:hypothetical protein